MDGITGRVRVNSKRVKPSSRTIRHTQRLGSNGGCHGDGLPRSGKTGDERLRLTTESVLVNLVQLLLLWGSRYPDQLNSWRPAP